MTKPTITFLFGCLLSLVGYSQRTIEPEDFKNVSIDSSLSWMKSNTKTADVFHEVGMSTLQRAKKNSDESILAQIHKELATWHAYNGLFSPDSAVHHTSKALEIHKKGTDKKKIADSYEVLARQYIKARKLAKSQDALFKAIPIYEELNDDDGLGSAYRTLGLLYQVMKDYKKSVEYTNRAIPLLEKSKNYDLLGMAQFNLIISYGELHEFEKAYQATDYCLEIVEQHITEDEFTPVKAHSYRGEVYVRAKDYKNALKDYIKSWELCVAIIGEERCATYRTEIGQVYLLQKDYREALDHLLAGVKAYERKGQATIIQQYHDLSKCYANLGDFENAIVYQEKAYENSTQGLKDRIVNLESEAVIKYETGKKNAKILLQDEKIIQQKRTKVLYIILISLLAIILFGLFYNFGKNNKRNQQLEELNNELDTKNKHNELLLKEIHHRVKNNLELVKSLIALQSAQLEDSVTKDVMIASQNRVQSMGIIHQKLYQGEHLGSIDMKDYFVNLGDGILDTFNAENQVKIDCAMEQLELDVDTAIPIGLIVNELVTNALKYAFPDHSKGKIEISLSRPNPDILSLKVIDNGIGKAEGLAPKGTGFGLQLIELLTKQLNGHMEENHENGTSVQFEFKIKTAA